MGTRKVVVLIHGYGEHIFRSQYNELTQHINYLGWEVRKHVIRDHWNGCEDHTNHSYYFHDFSALLGDLVSEVQELGDDARVVVVGKSLGGLMAIRLLEELSDQLKKIVVGAIALSPCLAIGSKYDSLLMRTIAYFIVEYLGWTSSYSPIGQLQVNDVTRKGREYSEDPHILSSGVWPAVAVATRNETIIARQRQDQIDKKLLIMHGAEDEVCNWEAAHDFASNTAHFSQIVTFTDTAHDLLDESPQVIEKIYGHVERFLATFSEQ